MKAVLALDAEAEACEFWTAPSSPNTPKASRRSRRSSRTWGWDEIEAGSGLIARRRSRRRRGPTPAPSATILCYGMGLTQHRSSSSTVQQLVNLLLLKGNIGRPGAGILSAAGPFQRPGRPHGGDREKPSAAFLDAMDRVFAFRSPREHGHTVVETIAAMEAGETRVFVGLGGNFAVAAPDPTRTHGAIQKAGLTVHVATKLNRTHLLHGAESLLLPCLGRTEIDLQAGVRQAVTVEDSMSMVHASRGLNLPPPTS